MPFAQEDCRNKSRNEPRPRAFREPEHAGSAYLSTFWNHGMKSPPKAAFQIWNRPLFRDRSGMDPGWIRNPSEADPESTAAGLSKLAGLTGPRPAMPERVADCARLMPVGWRRIAAQSMPARHPDPESSSPP